MDISIIVPVFNVEKYLNRCLDSIFIQNFSGTFEVIAVDDGSTDRSLEILNDYGRKESRLKIMIHPENRKLSVARRTGMNASSGDYIMHVDSDDWMLPGSLEIILLKCKSSDADVIVFDYLREDSLGRQFFKTNIRNELFVKDKLPAQQYFYDAPWNKVVKRRLTQNMIYGTIGMNSVEDLIYSMEIFLRANSILLLNKVLYVYFVNLSSLTQTVNVKAHLNNQKVIFNELQKILNENKYAPEFKRILFKQRETVIYHLLLKNHLLKKEARISTDDFVNHLQLYYSPSDKKLTMLIKSAKNKYFCMIQYALNIGILKSFLTLLRKVFQSHKSIGKPELVL